MLLRAGDLTLDLDCRHLYLNGNGEDPVKLFPMEARLLAALPIGPLRGMEFQGQVVSRAHLMRTVWQTNYLDDTRTLDVHICWLRRKVEEDPSHPRRIVTHRRQGYELRV